MTAVRNATHHKSGKSGIGVTFVAGKLCSSALLHSVAQGLNQLFSTPYDYLELNFKACLDRVSVLAVRKANI